MNLVEVALGIITAIGGFLDVGSIATAAEAGASFRFQLLWTVLLGTICLTFLVEMSGRLAAVSKHTLADAVRHRFGFKFTVLPRLLELIVNFLVLSAELGGVALAVKLVTGWSLRATVLPIAILAWLLIWLGTLEMVENSTAILGLLTICFVVAAWKFHPDPHEVLRGFLPSVPRKDPAHYWFIAVSILGATVSPYMFHFYSSGAVEEKWDEKSLGMNRFTAVAGMGFGSLISIALVVVAGVVFAPHGVRIDAYEQVGLILLPIFGHKGFVLLAVCLGVCCFGAAVEVALATAYMLAQTFGWNWAEDDKPHREARFAATYSLMLFASPVLIIAGADPLRLTMYAMALTAAILPLVVMPFMLLLNDESYVKKHRNGPIGNAVVIFTIVLSSLVALVTIPLEIAGG